MNMSVRCLSIHTRCHLWSFIIIPVTCRCALCFCTSEVWTGGAIHHIANIMTFVQNLSCAHIMKIMWFDGNISQMKWSNKYLFVYCVSLQWRRPDYSDKSFSDRQKMVCKLQLGNATDCDLSGFNINLEIFQFTNKFHKTNGSLVPEICGISPVGVHLSYGFALLELSFGSPSHIE